MSHPSYDELSISLQQAGEAVPVEALYRHYSTGNVYRVIGHIILKQSDEVAVVYEPVEHPEVSWGVPLREFTEVVTTDGWCEPRFRRIEPDQLGIV